MSVAGENRAKGEVHAPDPSRRLPLVVEDVTADWLTRILGDRFDGVTVKSVEIRDSTEGTASRFRLSLTYARNDAGLPNHLFLKTAFHAWRGHLGASGLYESEVRFYAELAPVPGVRTPSTYAAVWDREVAEAGQFVLLLEDVGERGATFGHATRPIDAGQAARVLDLCAALHAAHWQDARLDGLSWLQRPNEIGRQAASFRRIAADVEARLEQRGHVMPRSVRDADRIRAAFAALQEVTGTERRCLSHGDTHLGNLFFDPDGTPGLADWQMVRNGCFMHDVAFHLIGSMPIDERRANERDLVAGHLAGLAARGVTDLPSVDEAWRLYRQHAVYGLFAWLINPSDLQLDDTNLANVERFSAAVADHGSFELLGA